MSDIGVALGMTAPYYNLGFVIVVVYLFIELFRTAQENENVYIAPWVYLFGAVITFVIEEALTVLRAVGGVQIGRQINGFFELVIIILFLYALMLQHQYVKNVFTHPSVNASSVLTSSPVNSSKTVKAKSSSR
ncbi:MAG: hypothetical protein AABX52_04635 [Nanoarchaeota archaeon]